MLLDMVALLLVGLPRSDQVRGRPSVPEVPNVSSRNCTKKIFPSLILARSENGEVISTPDLRPRYVNEPNIATLSPCSRTSRTSKASVSHAAPIPSNARTRSEEHTSELQSLRHLVCRLLLQKRIAILMIQTSIAITTFECRSMPPLSAFLSSIRCGVF